MVCRGFYKKKKTNATAIRARGRSWRVADTLIQVSDTLAI